MYKAVEDRFRKALRHHIHERYKTDVPVLTELPPKLAMGEAASPVCFELAKRLKKAPRLLAQEIANSLPPIDGIARVEVAGGGYLNAFFDRPAFFRAAIAQAGKESIVAAANAPKTVVEHTSVNPRTINTPTINAWLKSALATSDTRCSAAAGKLGARIMFPLSSCTKASRSCPFTER